jgi:serine/threonine protein phosphatase PrpC
MTPSIQRTFPRICYQEYLSEKAIALRQYTLENLDALIYKLNKSIFPELTGQMDGSSISSPLSNTTTLSTKISTPTPALSIGQQTITSHTIQSQGDRESMEDMYANFSLLMQGKFKAQINAVLDGHRGIACATMGLDFLKITLKQALEQPNEEPVELFIYNTLKAACTRFQRDWLLRFKRSKSGTTLCLTLTFQRAKHTEVWCANIGDSGAILITPEETHQLSETASLTTQKFQVSLKRYGGNIIQRTRKNNTVSYYLDASCGGIAMARALGDGHITGLSPRPKIARKLIPIGTPCRIVVASDGLWGIFGSKKVATMIGTPNSTNEQAKTAQQACQRLFQAIPTSLENDNITIICADIQSNNGSTV